MNEELKELIRTFRSFIGDVHMATTFPQWKRDVLWSKLDRLLERMEENEVESSSGRVGSDSPKEHSQSSQGS